MYHLSDHKRALHSAEEIGQGLLMCLQNKPMSEVTVSDIHRLTGISRSTFYRLFDAPDDVLLYLCDQYKTKLAEVFRAYTFTDAKDIFLFSLRYSLQNYILLDVLVQNHRNDLLDDLHGAVIQHLSERLSSSVPSEKGANPYTDSLLHAVMTASLTIWVRRNRLETPEEFLEYIREFSLIMNEFAQQL